MASSLAMLLLVLVAIPVVLWIVKRAQTLRVPGQQRQMEILAQLPLSPRERVVMVRVQDRVLVLGAGAGGIHFLTEADAGALPPAPAPGTPAAPGFAALLKNLSAGMPQRRP